MMYVHVCVCVYNTHACERHKLKIKCGSAAAVIVVVVAAKSFDKVFDCRSPQIVVAGVLQVLQVLPAARLRLNENSFINLSVRVCECAWACVCVCVCASSSNNKANMMPLLA